jgi:hypothetical protein
VTIVFGEGIFVGVHALVLQRHIIHVDSV